MSLPTGGVSMQHERTDWDSYYERPFPAASLTRRYTTSRLIDSIQRNVQTPKPSIAELGGANSCFFAPIAAAVDFGEYHIVDNSRVGLQRTAALAATDRRLTFEDHDVLLWDSPKRYDLVFSVGLIEHFDMPTTAGLVKRHFAAAKPGGIVIISVPTPTALYRVTRAAAEMLSMWKFPDERPLLFGELETATSGLGTLVSKEVLWPIVLTQLMASYRV